MTSRRAVTSAFDPLFSVAVCFVSVLIVVIIILGINTSDQKIVLPTPIDVVSAKRAIYVECRGDELFLIPVEELSSRARKRLAEAGGNVAAARPATNEHYAVDLKHFLAVQGQRLAVTPVSGSHGYALRDPAVEPASGWFAQLLRRMNHQGEMIQFVVRDDSFRVFKNARTMAMFAGAEVAFELLTVDEPVSFPASL